jgi:hypothetical protein
MNIWPRLPYGGLQTSGAVGGQKGEALLFTTSRTHQRHCLPSNMFVLVRASHRHCRRATLSRARDLAGEETTDCITSKSSPGDSRADVQNGLCCLVQLRAIH